MQPSRPQVHNVLSVCFLTLALAALQSPLLRPVAAPPSVIAKVGGTMVLTLDDDVETAKLLENTFASLASSGPHRLLIHGNTPGHTRMIVHYKNGGRKLFEIVVLSRVT